MNKNIILFFILISGFAYSQQHLPDNQYMVNKFSLSPAYAGTEESFEGYMTYRQNWVGYKDAPQSEFISVNGPMQKSGIGAYVINNRAGVFRNNLVSLSYAYHVKINEDQKIHLGISAGFLYSSIDFSSVTNQDIIDPVIGENRFSEGSTGDAAFGAAYQFRQIHVGITLPRLLESKINNQFTDKTIYTLPRSYRFHITNSFNLNNDGKIEPYLILSKTSHSSVFYEVAAMYKYKNRLWAGINYKKNNAFGLFIGLIYNRYVMNFSYEGGFSGPVSKTPGTYEVTLGILIGKSKKITNDLPFIKSSKPYNEWIH